MVHIAKVRAGISPKDFAEAIGVSESSVKRWVDQGTLKAARTAGGHRRIARDEALRFIREQHGQLVRPDKLGLDPGVLGVSRTAPLQHAADQLHNYLVTGRDAETRGVLTGLYLAGNTIAAIADDVVRPAMERLGGLWREGEHGIMVEHRATNICLRVFEELRGMLNESHATLKPGQSTNRLAIVAGPAHDPYFLPPTLAGLTLVEVGWQIVNLGPDTPLSVVELAMVEVDACLIALSVTSSPQPKLRAEVLHLIDTALAQGRFVAIGGQTFASLELAPRANLFAGKSLESLAVFARKL